MLQALEGRLGAALFAQAQAVELLTYHKYYVATMGNDANPGTFAAPFRTIQRACNTVNMGSLIYIRGGTYREKVTLTRGGDADKWIIIRNYPGETPVIDGTGIAFTGSSLVELSGVGYVRVIGLHVINSDDSAIRAVRCNHIEILNNFTELSHASGIGVWRCDQVLVSGNKVKNARFVTLAQGGHEEAVSIATTTDSRVTGNEIWMEGYPGWEGSEAIDAKDGAQRIEIDNNSVHGYNDYGCIYVDGWEHETGDIDIHDNHLSGSGIYIGSERGGLVRRVKIRNNTIFRSASGICLTRAGLNGPRSDVEIFNNSIVGSRSNGGAGIYVATDNAKRIRIHNNAVQFSGYNGQITAASKTVLAEITCNHNMVYGPTACSQAFPACVELSRLPGNTIADPQFVSTTLPDFHLQPTSPAIGAGLDMGYGLDIGAS